MSHLPSQPALSRRPRPCGPRCRGGVSSLLRLAQPAGLPALGPWIVRLAATRAPRRPAAFDGCATTPAQSIITRLLPSHELARG